MFHEQLREAVEQAATYPQIQALERLLWQQAWPQGLVDEAQASALSEALHVKRQLLQAKPAPLVGFKKGSGKPPRSEAQNQAAIERRRRWAACCPLPPELAAQFTQGEQAVLRVVADDLKARGICVQYIDRIAALAGCGRTLVRNALRKARRLRLLTVEERRRAGQRSLTNVVRFLCKKWQAWITRHKIGVIFPRTTTHRSQEKTSGRFADRPQSGFPGEGLQGSDQKPDT